MPTYEYECVLGHTFEVQQRITEEPLTRCQHPEQSCQGHETMCLHSCKRLIFAPSFSLKGGGWESSGYSRTDRSRGK